MYSRLAVVFIALWASLLAVAVPAPEAALEERAPAADAAIEERSWHWGEATYYYPDDGNAGACGWYNLDTDYVLAVSHDIYNGGQYCGVSVTITNTATGGTATGTVVDECEGCDPSHIDLSPSLFEALGEDLSVGVFTVSWYFD